MTDILIKNGTVVDGTGAKAFAADVRITDGTISEVGPDLAAAREWAQASAEGGYFRGQYNFGLMLAEEGQLDEAAAWLKQALDGAPEPSRGVMARALAARPEAPLADVGRRTITPEHVP